MFDFPRPEPAASATAKIPIPSSTVTPASGNFPSLDEVERQHIVAVLTQTNWRIEGDRGAAKLLNLQPSTLRSRMQKLRIVRRRA